MKTLALAAAAAVALAAVPAQAAWPEKNIDFVIPFGAGGGFDRTVRLISPYVEKYLPSKVEVLPKNVPGAGGARGMTMTYRAKPDGYTISIANMPGAALPGLLGEPNEYDLQKYTWIARLATAEYVLGASAKSNIRTVADLKSFGKPIKFTSTDASSTGYAATVIMGAVIGYKVHHLLGYSGSTEFIVAAVRGDGEATVAPVASIKQFVQSGDMRAVFSTEQKSTLPGVPTVAAAGYPELTGLAVDRFVVAPPGLPAAIAEALSNAFMKAMADPALIEAAEKAGEPFSGLPPAAAKESAERSIALYLKYKDALAKKD
jgi:tripartite-type tricarboxylate transporter receptor subunit TctC